MPFLGKNSGFRTTRDVILFGTGLFIDIYHILTTAPEQLSVKLLLFGAGLAGSPTVFRSDERYDDEEQDDPDKHKKRRRANDDAEQSADEQDYHGPKSD